MKLTLIPITLDEANAFVEKWHRHHKAVPGCKFCIGVALDYVVGVAIVGRPVARLLDDGWTLEVNRTCTDGTKNANSMLYGACRPSCMGSRIQTSDYLHIARGKWGQLERCKDGNALVWRVAEHGRAIHGHELTFIRLKENLDGKLSFKNGGYPFGPTTKLRGRKRG